MAATGKVENEDLVAATLLQLTLAMPTWIARRSEALEILDNRVGRRRVSVEVDLGARVWSGVGKLAGPTLVPLAVLDRNKSSANFQVVDESGRKLARLNRSEERRLVFLGFSFILLKRVSWVRIRWRPASRNLAMRTRKSIGGFFDRRHWSVGVN